jgi:drug/metabolite transporter (DMT)-like permease
MAVASTGVGLAVWYSREGNSALKGVSGRTMMIGVVCALLSAACQGVGVVMQRQGFQSVGVLTGSMMRLWPAVILLVVARGLMSRHDTRPGVLSDSRRVAWIGGAAFIGAFLGCLLMAAGAKYAKAGVAAMLSSSHPLWVIPIAYWFLRERANAKVIAATLMAVGGIVIMLL